MTLESSRVVTAHPQGILGPIWRSAAAPWAVEPIRICWLPALHAQAL